MRMRRPGRIAPFARKKTKRSRPIRLTSVKAIMRINSKSRVINRSRLISHAMKASGNQSGRAALRTPIPRKMPRTPSFSMMRLRKLSKIGRRIAWRTTAPTWRSRSPSPPRGSRAQPGSRRHNKKLKRCMTK